MNKLLTFGIILMSLIVLVSGILITNFSGYGTSGGLI